ncbi:MAG TPA: agmatinase, partial [Hyphomicrobiaceae bacterium]|nr:agmatinase [Hyphomicrobiaceae bacterium]
MSLKLDYLPAEESFLDPVRADAGDPASARAVVIPFGLEASVSYGGGTGSGPAAILAASHQLELYDDELECEPYLRYGVAAVREPVISRPVEAALTQLQSLVEAVLDAGKFPLVLGGEHSLTVAPVRALAARHKDLAVLQLDAHADLRDGYQGERFSHAAAMRRVLDSLNVSLVSVGIRAISREEVEFYQANRDRITIHWAKDRARWNLDAMLAPLKGRPVYLTFDIDALDASVMPATGTPTPGGLSYGAALEIVRRACGAGNVVGADLVELAPIEGLHACDYTAAAIAYKMLSYTLA